MIVALGNLYYYPLKLYVFIASYLYFRKLRVAGRRNIPLKGPVIYAINHQNALLDALLLSVLSWRSPHFLTRADVFNNRFVNQFLRGLKMLPIYRIRDGYGDVKKNDAIFLEAKKILTDGGTMGIFPEGSHSLQYKIRPLKKGISRIAFMSEEAAAFNLNVQIVPIGIQYESHFYAKGRTLVSFGEPIRVGDYREVYEQEPNKASEQLLTRISGALKALVLTIDSKENYDQVLQAFKQRRVFKIDLQDQLRSDQALVDAIENGGGFEGVSDKKNVLLHTFDGLVYLVRKVLGFIPGFCIDLLVNKTVKDPHFYGTMRFAYSVFLYPLIWFVLYLLIRLVIFFF